MFSASTRRSARCRRNPVGRCGEQHGTSCSAPIRNRRCRPSAARRSKGSRTGRTTPRRACSPSSRTSRPSRSRWRRVEPRRSCSGRSPARASSSAASSSRSKSPGSRPTAAALFLSFRDATSGGESYGGGRYLLDTVKGADLGEDDGRLVLDFNFAYNPSCSYDPGWVCPLAPPANRLSVAMEAGEKQVS